MRKPLSPMAVAAAGLCVGLSGPAGAGQSSAANEPSASTKSDIDVQVPDSHERLGEYWTRDRMRAAKPMPTPRISREPAVPAAEDEDADRE